MIGEPSGAVISTVPNPFPQVQADLETLLRESYGGLRALARAYLQREPSASFAPTSLVHEAYLHVVRQRVQWIGREHFCAVAAMLMRRVLVKHAKRRQTRKRGGGRVRVMLDATMLWCQERCGDLIALNEALDDLADFAPRQARVVSLRFFGGMAMDEIARVIGVGDRTVYRDWMTARAWLRGRLKKRS
jgi:RNA polymerase sigma factor (TIGR02999 family)